MGLKPEQFNLFLKSDFVSIGIECQLNLGKPSDSGRISRNFFFHVPSFVSFPHKLSLGKKSEPELPFSFSKQKESYFKRRNSNPIVLQRNTKKRIGLGCVFRKENPGKFSLDEADDRKEGLILLPKENRGLWKRRPQKRNLFVVRKLNVEGKIGSF